MDLLFGILMMVALTALTISAVVLGVAMVALVASVVWKEFKGGRH